MKRLILCLVCMIIVLGIATANAAIQYLTLEELKQTSGPATVHVIAKSTEPTGKSGAYLTSKTTWQWRIQNQAGYFAYSGLSVNMDQYQSMSLSERSFVLNHKECDLTIEISESRTWNVKKISGVSKPVSKDDIGTIVLATLGISTIIGLGFVWELMQEKAGTRSSDQYIKKTRILAINGVQYTTHDGVISNAIIGHMVAGNIGALIGAMSAEQTHSDNEFTFLVYYGKGKKGNKREVEKVRQSSKRFSVLIAKLEDV